MEDKSLRERLNEMFSRYNYVGICNVTAKTFKWTVALEQNEILNMGPSDQMSEEEMTRKGGDSFLPMDGVMKKQSKVVEYVLEPGEKKMVPGEAAYVLVDKLYKAAIAEKYGEGKEGLSKIVVPSYQDEIIPDIVCGPIIKNVGQVLNDFVGNLQENLEGFSNVEVAEKKNDKPETTRTKPVFKPVK